MMLECSSVSHLLEGSLPHPTAGTVLTAQLSPVFPGHPSAPLVAPLSQPDVQAASPAVHLFRQLMAKH